MKSVTICLKTRGHLKYTKKTLYIIPLAGQVLFFFLEFCELDVDVMDGFVEICGIEPGGG